MEEQGVYWQAAGSEEERRAQVRELHEILGEVAGFADETGRRGAGLVVEIF
jgi:hypothetical protein